MLLGNQILLTLCVSLNQISDIREGPLKDGFRSFSQKFYGAAVLWWVDQETLNF